MSAKKVAFALLLGGTFLSTSVWAKTITGAITEGLTVAEDTDIINASSDGQAVLNVAGIGKISNFDINQSMFLNMGTVNLITDTKIKDTIFVNFFNYGVITEGGNPYNLGVINNITRSSFENFSLLNLDTIGNISDTRFNNATFLNAGYTKNISAVFENVYRQYETADIVDFVSNVGSDTLTLLLSGATKYTPTANLGYIGSIKNSVFRNNTLESKDIFAMGGAMSNFVNIPQVLTNALPWILGQTGNAEYSKFVPSDFGAEIKEISNTVFENNHVISRLSDWNNNPVSYFPDNSISPEIKKIVGDIIPVVFNKTNAFGGAIMNMGTIKNVSADFLNNSAESVLGANGGAYSEFPNPVLPGIVDILQGNTVAKFTPSFNDQKKDFYLTVDFSGTGSTDHVTSDKGYKLVNAELKLNNQDDYNNFINTLNRTFNPDNAEVSNSFPLVDIADLKPENEIIPAVTFVNSNFINNKAVASNGEAKGGAIYTRSANIVADGKNSVFRGNTANGKSNAIYVENEYTISGAEINNLSKQLIRIRRMLKICR